VNTWNDYFNWLGMPTFTDQVRDSQLVEALRSSRRQGYHGGQQRQRR